MRLFRSWLFIPGSDSRKIAKAVDFPADVIIYDLQDAVAPAEKDAARNRVRRALESHHGPRMAVRVNEPGSPQFEKDLLELGLAEGCWGIVLPKVERPEQLERANELLDRQEKERKRKGFHEPIRLIPILETALGICNVYEIAKGRRVFCLAFGSLDYALDIGAELTGEGLELLFPRIQLVLASRVSGIQSPVDAVYPDFRDLAGLERETRLVKSFGFQGKFVIHPDQIETVNRVFLPSPEELAEARAIVEAYERAVLEGSGAIQVNGRMVDLPVVERAKRMLERYGS